VNRFPALLAWALCANQAVADAVEVDWGDLRAGRPQSCTDFLAPLEDDSDCDLQSWMARLSSSKIAVCAPGAGNLDGSRVSIAGYAHPLEVEFRDVRDFLLTPPLRGDCRHPSPPLPDQTIRVSYAPGIDISFDPVWVTGTLTLERSEDQNAPASYRLDAETVRPATLMDVKRP